VPENGTTAAAIRYVIETTEHAAFTNYHIKAGQRSTHGNQSRCEHTHAQLRIKRRRETATLRVTVIYQFVADRLRRFC
jgi:hypothetical protein